MIFSVISALLAFVCYIPCGRDILRGRVQTARSSRIMLTLLLVVVLVQQVSLGSGLALAVTVGELIGSLAIMSLSLRHGVGGWQRHEVVCYGLLGVSLVAWLLTSNAFLALHLSIAADLVAFAPTLVKTWRLPASETPIFYGFGALAALLSVFAVPHISYVVVVFAAYLTVVNVVELLLIYRPRLLGFMQVLIQKS